MCIIGIYSCCMHHSYAHNYRPQLRFYYWIEHCTDVFTTAYVMPKKSEPIHSRNMKRLHPVLTLSKSYLCVCLSYKYHLYVIYSTSYISIDFTSEVTVALGQFQYTYKNYKFLQASQRSLHRNLFHFMLNSKVYIFCIGHYIAEFFKICRKWHNYIWVIDDKFRNTFRPSSYVSLRGINIFS